MAVWPGRHPSSCAIRTPVPGGRGVEPGQYMTHRGHCASTLPWSFCPKLFESRAHKATGQEAMLAPVFIRAQRQALHTHYHLAHML